MDEKPAKAWVWYIVGLVALFGAALIMLGTGTAHSQPACEPLAKVIDDLGSKFQEQIVWEGIAVSPRGGPPVQALLFQSPKGTWTMIAVQGITACLMAAGTDATPLENGKGV